MILTLPALGALRQAFPRASITLIGPPDRTILARHPCYVNHLADPEQWELYRLFSQEPLLPNHLAETLRTCELVLSYLPTVDDTLTTNLRRYCSGEVITWCPHPPGGVHSTEHLLTPVRHFLSQPCNPVPYVYPDVAAQQAAEQFWSHAKLPREGVIALHPGSGGTYKLWPLAGWQQVIAWAVQQGLPGIIISGPAEQERHLRLGQLDQYPGWVVANSLPLLHLAAILARCQVVLGHDSGITHLAAAVGATVLALFGPTDPLVWGPRSQRACVLHVHPLGPLTLENVSPAYVVNILGALLQGTFTFVPSQVECTILPLEGSASPLT
jgi:heptosyltransferase-2